MNSFLISQGDRPRTAPATSAAQRSGVHISSSKRQTASLRVRGGNLGVARPISKEISCVGSVCAVSRYAKIILTTFCFSLQKLSSSKRAPPPYKSRSSRLSHPHKVQRLFLEPMVKAWGGCLKLPTILLARESTTRHRHPIVVRLVSVQCTLEVLRLIGKGK